MEEGRKRRWPRRVALAVVAVLMSVTLASFGFHAATAARVPLPAGLKYAEADGVRTRYLEWGSGNGGPPVVLVHGFVESADTWRQVGAILGRQHRVYAIDVTGWGYSQRRGPYTATHEAAQ